MAALGAAIGIQGQGSNPSGEKSPTMPIVSAGPQRPAKCRPAMGAQRTSGFSMNRDHHRC
jgi:hypothetical protein